MSSYRNSLDIITEGRTIPDGYDAWALKSTKADGATRNSYRWPGPGEVAKAAGPFTRGSSCPTRDGDGICIATSYAGMATGGHSAATMLLVAYRSEHVLGAEDGKIRVTQCLVVDRIDGEDVVTRLMSGADLYRADLHDANLYGADLRDADLRRSNLSFADLRCATLYGANLHAANLYGAALSDANLSRAYLYGAVLYGADLSGANLSGADLSSAYLDGANLSGANLSGATMPAGWPPA